MSEREIERKKEENKQGHYRIHKTIYLTPGAPNPHKQHQVLTPTTTFLRLMRALLKGSLQMQMMGRFSPPLCPFFFFFLRLSSSPSPLACGSSAWEWREREREREIQRERERERAKKRERNEREKVKKGC